MTLPTEEQVRNKLTDLITEKGIEVVELVLNLRNNKIQLRADREEGIDVGTCIELTRAIENQLETSGLDPEDFDVEVASAGLDRPLTTFDAFKRFVGKLTRVTLSEEREGRSTMIGRITGIQSPNIILFEEERMGPIEIPFEGIQKARLIPEIK